MLLKQVIEVCEQFDDPNLNGQKVVDLFSAFGLNHIRLEHLEGEKGDTDVVQVIIPGSTGKTNGGTSPTLGVLGTLDQAVWVNGDSANPWE